MASDQKSLSALSDHEREVLRLLAQGHTAKSIADRIGRSTGAVNERLREARRKSGIGSSRELARLLASQENRDTKIGMETPSGDEAARHPEARQSGLSRRARGAAIVIAIILPALIAGATILHDEQRGSDEQSKTSVMASDPLLGATMPKMVDPKYYYNLVRSENRDPAWAANTESVAGRAYTAILLRYGITEPARVICATTICEVAIRSLNPNNMPAKRVNRLYQDLQGKSVSDAMKKAGLEFSTGIFGPSYAGYWTKIHESKTPQPAAPSS